MKIIKLSLDTLGTRCHYSLCTRRYLSWIEGLTTNQDVRGSNPLRRTSEHEGPPTWEAFCFLGRAHAKTQKRPLGFESPAQEQQRPLAGARDGLAESWGCPRLAAQALRPRAMPSARDMPPACRALSGSNPQLKNDNAPVRGRVVIWRRAGDSNPRRALRPLLA